METIAAGLAVSYEQSGNEEGTGMRVSGVVDFFSSPALSKTLHQWLEKGVAILDLNLEAVSYIDSSGIAILVDCLRQLNRRSGKLVLRNVTQPVRNLLELTGVMPVFLLA